MEKDLSLMDGKVLSHAPIPRTHDCQQPVYRTARGYWESQTSSLPLALSHLSASPTRSLFA
eukprot:290790-Amphidinium_carterae.1